MVIAAGSSFSVTLTTFIVTHAILVVAEFAALWYAFTHAVDGYEDELGFHRLPSDPKNQALRWIWN